MKSRSVGEGHFKKIKIYVMKEGAAPDSGDDAMDSQDEAFGNR